MGLIADRLLYNRKKLFSIRLIKKLNCYNFNKSQAEIGFL